MKPCKHLDYDRSKYEPGCELRELHGLPGVRYWHRLNVFPGDPVKVQFCGKGRGRINAVLDCYEPPGPVGCYEPAPESGPNEKEG